MIRTYPCTVYHLTTNYNVRKVILARPFSTSYGGYGSYTQGGKFYRDRDVFETPAKAIHEGRKKLRQWKRSLEQAQESLAKQTAALDKAEMAAKKGQP
jgi:hypothetical protein